MSFTIISRRKRHPWTKTETEILVNAVKEYGKKWSFIEKKYPIFKENNRTQVDLKDKYRNVIKSKEKKSARKSRKSRKSRKLKKIEKDFMIFTKQGCEYCKKTKELLKEKNLGYKYFEINDENKEQVYKIIDSKTNKYRFFPVIFYKGDFIGGYTELDKILRKKEI